MSDRQVMDPRAQDLGARVQRLLHPGPLDWLLKLNPPVQRFHAGTHLHGLDDREPPALTRPRSH